VSSLHSPTRRLTETDTDLLEAEQELQRVLPDHASFSALSRQESSDERHDVWIPQTSLAFGALLKQHLAASVAQQDRLGDLEIRKELVDVPVGKMVGPGRPP
jgi:hypothetical protein